MYFLIHCLVIGSAFVLSNGNGDLAASLLAEWIVEDIQNGGSNLTGSDEHKLTLIENGELGKSLRSVVWKGVYNDEQDVAVKVFMDVAAMEKEMTIYNALDAVKDQNIEDHHIPRIYYSGKFLGVTHAIAMSRFDGTLNDYCKRNNKSLSDADILDILSQTVKGLEYLSTKNVVHNDINPNNLFYRDRDFFIGDFDLAALNGKQTKSHTELFASFSFFAGKPRFAKDDLEALVYSLWFLAGVPLEKTNKLPPNAYKPGGQTFFENRKQGNKFARKQLMKKIKYFTNEYVRAVFEDIMDKDFFSSEPIPVYQGIIQTVADAIKKNNESQQNSGSTHAKRRVFRSLSKFLCTI